MAVKYRFPFESVEGQNWTIDILSSGYSGAVKVRHLGGPPMLRKDKNENICGTSLDLTAECAVDGEFEEFSSSDPYAFQAKVYHGSSLVWQGFVSPELYSAPDIAPPYDVRVTATDGLGELKLHDFEAQGRKTLSALFTYLLGFTGLSLGFRQITDLSCSASGIGNMLTSVYVNIDYLAGETCYDVLQYLLATIHSTITQDGDYWLIQKETGITVIAGGAVACYNNGVSAQRGVPVFGSMRTNSIWPVGHMTREYVAPKKKMVVTADNHYRPNILSDSSWVLDGGTTDEGAYWELPNAGDGMTQTISFQQEVSRHLMLSIKVRNVGNGQDAGNLGVYVKLAGSHYQAANFLYLTKVEGGSYRRKGVEWYWGTSSSTNDFEVQAPSETDTDQDYVTIDVRIPLYSNSARSYVRASSLEIQVFNGDQLYPKRIYGISLYQYEQTKGFRKVVNIDNGARGEAPDVSLVFPCSTGVNDYNGMEEMLYGMPVDSSGARITSWSTYNFSNMDFMSLIARDYAASYAAPRVRLSGALQIGGGSMPIMFIDSFDSVLYIIESFSWDLYNDEISAQMISKPGTSSITVDSESTEEGETGNPMGHAQAETSGTGGGGGGGGSYTAGTGINISNNVISLQTASENAIGGIRIGYSQNSKNYPVQLDNNGKAFVNVPWEGGGSGGGGTVTSVDMTVPTNSGFKVEGNPITGAGTLAVSLISQAKNKFLASPSNASGVPTFRVLASSDIPDLSGKYVTLDTTQNNISGEKTFTTKPVHIGSTSGIDVNGSSYIDIGEARLVYDSTNKALHITMKSGSSQTIGLYADGFVSARGAAASGDQIKFVALTGAQSVDGVKTFLANIIANGTITINGVTLTGSSSKLSLNKNASFAGISDRVNGSNTTHEVSIQDIVNRLVALENS